MINIRFRRAVRDKPGATANPKIQEPPMEEILASARRIISEGGGSKPKEDAVPGSTPAEKSNTAQKADALELTDMVDEYGFVTKLDKKTPAATVESPLPNPVKPQIESKEVLLSKEAAAVSFSSLAELASAVARQEMTRADVPLETSNLVAELLRPTLREWLDKNLPGLIDPMVRREIEKLVRRTEDRQSPTQTRY